MVEVTKRGEFIPPYTIDLTAHISIISNVTETNSSNPITYVHLYVDNNGATP